MELSLFDLHCDTAYEMHRQGRSLASNNLAISLESAKKFKQYCQVMAIWTDQNLSDEEGWNAFHNVYQYLLSDSAIQNRNAKIVTTAPNVDEPLPTLLLGVEDARILNGREERMDELYRMGIRFLTPLWKGETCIGGSHNTMMGLTEFGKRSISRAIELGMILDISHASERSADDILSIATAYNRPIVATHSNAFDICPVSRNLHRWQAEAILHCGGVVGINLYPTFLRKDKSATLQDVLRHIEYFLELGFENNLCLGCDMDGADMPAEIHTVADLESLAELMLSKNYTEQFISDLFFANAQRFAEQNL